MLVLLSPAAQKLSDWTRLPGAPSPAGPAPNPTGLPHGLSAGTSGRDLPAWASMTKGSCGLRSRWGKAGRERREQSHVWRTR